MRFFKKKEKDLPDVTVATSCWEKDWKYLLLEDDFIKNKKIANHGFSFTNRVLVINNVKDYEKVLLFANKLKSKKILTHIHVAKDYEKEIRQTKGLIRKYLIVMDYRRKAVSQIHCYWRAMFEEIGKRLGMSCLEVRFLLPMEAISLLKDRVRVSGVSNRREYSVFAFLNGERMVLENDEAKEFEKKEFSQEVPVKKVLEGMGVSAGSVRGKAIVLMNSEDLPKVKKGDILVTSSTSPDLVPALGKVAGVITDEGGMTCHAAIVTRELGIPCITGTQNATSVIREGDWLLLDADNNRVVIDGTN